jgi:hypothetical protein
MSSQDSREPNRTTRQPAITAADGSDATAPYSVDWDTTTVTDGDVTGCLQVAMIRVEPGDPDNSYLIRKLEGARYRRDPDAAGRPVPEPGGDRRDSPVDCRRRSEQLNRTARLRPDPDRIGAEAWRFSVDSTGRARFKTSHSVLAGISARIHGPAWVGL